MRRDIAEYLNWSKEKIEEDNNIKNDAETVLYRKNIYIPIIINTNGEDVLDIIKEDFKYL